LSLIIFAEGTRSADGHVARFKAGSFLLAMEAGLPIVPLAVVGTREVMPRGRLRTEPAKVRLIIHDPILPPAVDAPTVHDAKQLAERVHAIVRAAVEERQFAPDVSVRSGSAAASSYSTPAL
jgi:1-acyl-sn-glycerol-3-phosphate acyltransferase